jgi:subtilisin family serine protease
MAATDTRSRKLHPRLRMIGNGDHVVNAVRSDGATTVACTASLDAGRGVATADAYALTAQAMAAPRATAQLAPPRAPLRARPRRGDRPAASDAFVNVFVEFYPEQMADAARSPVQEVTARMRNELAAARHRGIPGALILRRNFLSATVPVTLLDELKTHPAIAFVHPADPLKLDVPAPTAAAEAAPSRAVGDPVRHGRGEGVLIGVIDVGGFDFAHPDFLDAQGRTRFVAIWDQGGDFRDPPAPFGYGAEFKRAHLDAALVAARQPGMPPATWIERQSQMEESSHGTHVASIAAGKSGVCPQALIAAVLVDVPAASDPVERRRATFSDTSRITHAVEYLLQVARDLNRPIAINISLGTNGGAHDGSSGVSRWLDAYLAAAGRAICVAAGNAGQEAPQAEGDLGWVMGRIHTSGRVPARGLEVELEWAVIGDGLEDLSENELEIWYGAQDRFAVAVKPPGRDWIEVRPGQYVENRRLPSGTTVSVYNELYHPTNGANYVAIYLSPNLDPQEFRGIDAGVWRVRLIGEEVRDGRFDAWIERDDPVEIGRGPGRRLFRFPSFFTQRSNVDSHSISSLACGHRVIAVANLDDVRLRINPSSSQGPTRDGRCKPEIAAPGTDVVAANGFGAPDEPWVAMSGTSMASPYVTGVVGLMLGANRELTAAQCLGILQRTARPLPGASYDWVNDVGYGRLDPIGAVEEARVINTRVEIE